MKAYQFTDTGKPLTLSEVPDPVPGAGEVVLDVRTCGLCHSDISIMHNEMAEASLPIVPLTLGHEIAGVISAVGEGVTDWAVGDRVGVWSTPREGSIPGFTRHGGYAEKHLAPTKDLVRIPDRLDFALSSYANDAGMTAYHGIVTRGGLQSGMKVGIIGIGGLGQTGARIGVLRGAEVHVAEPKKDVWPLAEELGAASVVADAEQWRGQDFDLIVDFAGFNTAERALEALKFGGTAVQVGVGAPEATINTGVLLREKSLLGSFGGTKDDLAAVYELLASGELSPVVSEIAFSQINEGLERLHAGTVTGRLVTRISN